MPLTFAVMEIDGYHASASKYFNQCSATTMPFWPFRKKSTSSASLTARDSEVSIEPIWEQLIAASAKGDQEQLQAICAEHHELIRANVERLRTVPKPLPAGIETTDQYVNAVVRVAKTLADQCDTPELWNAVVGSPTDHPMRSYEIWCNEFAERLHQLEHLKLIAEANDLIHEVQQTEGTAPAQYLAYLAGRLGDAQFHSGQSADALISYDQALQTCRKIGDAEGELIYLNQMFEAYRYLGKHEQALDFLQRVIDRSSEMGARTDDLQRKRERLLMSEPLCRVVCVIDDADEFEVDHVNVSDDTHVQFFFRRNRPSLLVAEILTQQGNELAREGDFVSAMEKFDEAMKIDPFDPDPVYQTGICLLETDKPDQAEATFEEVERLAPGWFHCRSDLWLAQQMADGNVSLDEFHILRGLEDGVMDQEQRSEIAEKAVSRYPDFAAYRLVYGDVLRNKGRLDEALIQYQKAVELAQEPDLESRALVAMLASSPPDLPSREAMLKRVQELDGNLIAKATAVLMASRD